MSGSPALSTSIDRRPGHNITSVRILSLLPSATEILFDLGLGDHVVGVTFECDFPPEARDKRIVSTSALPEGLSPAEIDLVVKERMSAGEDLYHLDRGAFSDIAPTMVVTQNLCAVCAIDVSEVDDAMTYLGCSAEVVTLDPMTLDEVIETADIFITATGNKDILMADDLSRMKHNAVVANIGHFDNEIDVAGLAQTEGVQRINIKPQVDEWKFTSGRSIILLSEGRLMNLGNATGHPSFVMSSSFTNQTIAQIELYGKTEDYDKQVYVLPKHLDEKVARLHLDALGVKLTPISPEQAAYIGVPVDGPYKSDHYRY